MSNDGKCAGGVEIGVRDCPKCGATEDDACPVEVATHLRHSSPERESLHKMLEVYWGSGDGEPAPQFIQDAAALCDYKILQ